MINTNYKTWGWREWLAAGVLAFVLIKVIANAIKNPLTGGGGANETREALKTDIEKEKSKPNYNTTQYNNFANLIENAGSKSFGTDEQQIYGVLQKMKNNADFLRLQGAFGKRRLEFSLTKGGLVEFLRTELSEKEIKWANDILKKNGITYSV